MRLDHLSQPLWNFPEQILRKQQWGHSVKLFLFFIGFFFFSDFLCYLCLICLTYRVLEIPCYFEAIDFCFSCTITPIVYDFNLFNLLQPQRHLIRSTFKAAVPIDIQGVFRLWEPIIQSCGQKVFISCHHLLEGPRAGWATSMLAVPISTHSTRFLYCSNPKAKLVYSHAVFPCNSLT